MKSRQRTPRRYTDFSDAEVTKKRQISDAEVTQLFNARSSGSFSGPETDTPVVFFSFGLFRWLPRYRNVLNCNFYLEIAKIETNSLSFDDKSVILQIRGGALP